jgi:trans-o-hydroxybenzylidenepyruvate hydratase-aldolase
LSKRKDRLTAADVKGAWAIIPTPATDNASDWRTEFTVDLDETARAVEGMIAAGIDGLLSLGTLGECGSLTWEEKKAFMACVVETARGRIPVFGGTSSLNTRETIRQTRAAHDIGMDGTMVGPSMWNTPDIDMATLFYKELAEAVPEMAICIYANPGVFKFAFPPPFWAKVAEIPQVVMAKTAGYASLLNDLRASKGRIRFLTLDAEYYGAARLAPEQTVAFWTSSASCGPAPAIALRDFVTEAKRTGDWSKAEAITVEMGQAVLPIVAYGDMQQFQIHNTALEKVRMNVAGWMKAGPNRPPYHNIPPRIAEFAKTGGELWAALQKKYSKGN